MRRRDEPDLVGQALFHHFAMAHDHDPVGHGADDAEVVADQNHRDPAVALQTLERIEHQRLDGNVEAGGGLVQQQQRRFERNGERRNGRRRRAVLANRIDQQVVVPMPIARRRGKSSWYSPIACVIPATWCTVPRSRTTHCPGSCG